MKYFYDFEFEENGKTIIPISLGMVSEDDRTLYLINAEYAKTYRDLEAYYWRNEPSVISQWLSQNVMNQITDADIEEFGVNYESWPNIVHKFISNDGKIGSRKDVQLWGYYGAYDHVALAQIYGSMVNLPEPIPMFTRETMQIAPVGAEYPTRTTQEHHALNDALYQKEIYELWTSKN